MIPNEFSLKADAAGSRYKVLTDAWQALFGRALTSPEFGFAGQANDLVREARDIALSYLSSEMDHITATLYEIAYEAQGRVKRHLSNADNDLLAVEAQTHLCETQSYIRDELAAQIQRDIANMRQSLQRVVLDTSLLQRTHRVKSRQAVVSWRLNNDETLDFNFTDRRAHRTPSAKFVRNVWRQTMLSIHNETTLFTLADHGSERAAIYKLIDNEEVLAAYLSLNGDGPSYGEIRSTLFHPNSNAYLGAI